MTRIRLSGAAILLLIAVSGARAQSTGELQLRAGDGVRLTVRDEPKLSGDFPVVQPGRVLLPEIGIVSVSDRPFSEVEDEVRKEYGKILVDAEILLVPLVRVAVLGEVREPGLFPIDPSQTVGDLLASAGGITESANTGKIDLVRGGTVTRLRLDPGALELAGRLRSGDQIVVGRRSWIHENAPIVIGAVASVLAAATTGLIVR
jgi:polysaccharide export outer membrane protein